MTSKLKVLTLNAWGIALPWPFGSKDRRVRISAITDALATGEWDIVSLQEIWNVDDYEYIKNRVSGVLPDAFYFHSGFIGSGVCIFTKGSICTTLMHRYSLNGYPHHLHRGDWFGGKIAGLARINLNGLHVDMYATHLHAEYDRINDLYLPHRVLQAFELSQFINETSTGDITIVVGDMNLEPTDLGYKLIVEHAGLSDAFTCCVDSVMDEACGATCDVASNCYTTSATSKVLPQGKRIDYILYRSNEKYQVCSQKCITALDRIPSFPNINYSDHQAVSATLEVIHTVEKKPILDHGDVPEKAIELMQIGIATSAYTRRMCGFVVGILLILFFWTINFEMAFEALVSRFALTLAIGFCFVHGLVGLKMEQKALEAAKASMLIMKKHKDKHSK